MTDFTKKAEILAEFHTEYWADSEFEEFNQYNDVGLPLAYAYVNGFCDLKNKGEEAIEETWSLLMQTLGITDLNFKNLSEVFETAMATDS